jgi:hypothetical protein
VQEVAMNVKSDAQSWPVGEASDWLCLAAAPAEGGRMTGLVLDREGPSLIELDWTPGGSLSGSSLALDGALPDEIDAAVGVARGVLITQADGSAFGLDRATGRCRLFGTLDGPATLAADGTQLIMADEAGVLATALDWGGTGPTLCVRGERVIAAELDPVSLVVLPKAASHAWNLAVGCYGWVELLNAEGPSKVRQAATAPRSVSAPDYLAYDPIFVSAARLVSPPQRGPWVYAVDEGGTGLVAISLRSGAYEGYPKTKSIYGTIGQAIAAPNGRNCLVRLARSHWTCWTPGAAPATVDLPRGEILAWSGRYALVLDRIVGLIHDVRLV